MQKNTTDLIKWLKILQYFQIAVLAFSLLDYIPINTSLFQWLKRLCNAGSIVCLFMLPAAGIRYRIAAIVWSVQLVLALSQAVIQFFVQLMMLQGVFGTEDFTRFNEIAAVLNLVAMVAGMVYTYQLYYAHGELVKDMDASLSRKWRSLFWWSFAVGILVSVSSMIFSTVYTNMGLNSQTLLTLFYSLINIPGQIIMLIGILYLNRTIQIIINQEE